MNTSHSMLTWLRSTLLLRAVATVFLLAIGWAHASPLLKPQSIELLCSGSGAMKLLVKSSDGDAEQTAHTSHCGMCALGDGAAPPAHLPVFLLPKAIASTPFARSRALAAPNLPPLPARGPPVFS